MAQAKPKHLSRISRRRRPKLNDMLGPTTFRGSRRSHYCSTPKNVRSGLRRKDITLGKELLSNKDKSSKRFGTLSSTLAHLPPNLAQAADSTTGEQNESRQTGLDCTIDVTDRGAVNRPSGNINSSEDKTKKNIAKFGLHAQPQKPFLRSDKAKLLGHGLECKPYKKARNLNDLDNVGTADLTGTTDDAQKSCKKRKVSGQVVDDEDDSWVNEEVWKSTDDEDFEEEQEDFIEEWQSLVESLKVWTGDSLGNETNVTDKRPVALSLGIVGDGREDTEMCIICGKAEDSTHTLLCDRCFCAVHMGCLKPSLTTPPESDEWLCPGCEKEREDEAKGCRSGPVNDKEVIEADAARKSPVTCSEGKRRWTRPSESGKGGKCQRLLRGDVFSVDRARIGPAYQADVPTWSGQPCDEEIDEDRPHFGNELEYSLEEKVEMQQASVDAFHNIVWPLNWLPASSLPEGTPEKWLQCTRVVYDEGDIRPDGKVVRRPVECGKWRRAPLNAENGPDWECSCAVVWDPIHSDCSVPQEFVKKEMDKRLRAIAEVDAQKVSEDEEKQWQEMRTKLAAWKAKHGSCNISSKEPLGQWLQLQRLELNRNRLSSLRKACLLEMGVILDLKDAKWEENFQELVSFKKKYGHCDVDEQAGLESCTNLLQWVKAQRVMGSQPTIGSSKEIHQICRLLEIGFNFSDE